jgi:preprotein translocase subunit SecG
MNPATIYAAQEGAHIVKSGARAAGRAAGSFFNEPIIGKFTLKKLTVWLTVLFILYLVWFFFIRKTEAEKAAEKAAETINGLPIDNSNLSLSQGDINLIAQQLYEAMDGAGTDEDAIMSLLDRISTRDDLLAVMKRFGTPRAGVWPFDHLLDLPGWFKEELSGDDLLHVRNVFLNFNVPF